MGKTIFLFLIFIGTFFLFLFMYDFSTEQEQKKCFYVLTEEEIDLIRDGDIILRHGYGFVSNMISKVLREEYSISHCGIISASGNGFSVIHSVSQSVSDFDGMQTQNLKLFVKHSKPNSVMIMRFKSDTENSGSIISKKASYYLNKKVPFDHSFDIYDDSKIYCTELIWRIIFDEFGINIFPDMSINTRNHLYFSNFYNPEFFEIIINHHNK